MANATVPITFGPLTGQIPLNDLDQNFAAILAYLNNPVNRDNFAIDNGAANAYIIAPAPPLTAYTGGQVLTFMPSNANTAASTINVNGLGAVTLYKGMGLPLAPNDLITTSPAVCVTDGTNVMLINPISGASTAAAGASMVLLTSINAAGIQEVIFTGLTNVYDEYEIHYNGLKGVATGALLQSQMSIDNGGSWLGTSYGFACQLNLGDSTSFPNGSTNGPAISVSGGVVGYSANAAAGRMIISGAAVPGGVAAVFFTASFVGQAGPYVSVTGSGECGTGNINAIKLFLTGPTNFLAGNFYLYGIKKA